jgi:hypothetical protein
MVRKCAPSNLRKSFCHRRKTRILERNSLPSLNTDTGVRDHLKQSRHYILCKNELLLPISLSPQKHMLCCREENNTVERTLFTANEVACVT